MRSLRLLIILCLGLASVSAKIAPQQAPPLIRTFEIPDDLQGDLHVPDSSPKMIIHGNKLFYSDGRSGPLRAFDANSLKQLWSWSGSWHQLYFCSAMNDIVYVQTINLRKGFAKFYALDANKGAVIWSSSDKGASGASSRQALFTGELLLLSGGRALTAFNSKTGAKLYDTVYDYNKQALTRAAKPKLSDRTSTDITKVLWGVDNKLICVDASSGNINWQFKVCEAALSSRRSDGYGGLGSEIIFASDRLALFRYYGRAEGLILFCVDIVDRTVKWQCRAIEEFVRDGNSAYVSQQGMVNDRGVRALDLETGKVRWNFSIPHHRMTPCLIYRNIVYFCACWIDVDQGYKCMSAIYAIDKDSGAALWQHTFPGWITSAPLEYEGKIYVLSPKTGEGDHNGILRIYEHQSKNSLD